MGRVTGNPEVNGRVQFPVGGGRQCDHLRARPARTDPFAELRAICWRRPVGALRHGGLRTARIRLDVDAQKNVQRLYWVQFEGYLPTRPELKHKYDSPRHADIGGMDFYVDTWVRTKDAETRPGSDVEHIVALIRAKGYLMPDAMMYVRLVHLLDEQKRKELMIIYGEDAAQSGLTAAELQPGGKAHDRWPTIAKGLLERAEKRVGIKQTGP